MNVYAEIIAAIERTIAGLDLRFTPEGASAPVSATVVRRKLPRVAELVGDDLPLITICPYRPERIEPASAEEASGVFVWYSIEIVIISAGNGDLVSNVPQILDWRQQIRRAFQDPVPINVSGVIDTQIRPAEPFDRRHINRNYDYSGLLLIIRTIEPRNNVVANAISAVANA